MWDWISRSFNYNGKGILVKAGMFLAFGVIEEGAGLLYETASIVSFGNYSL